MKITKIARREIQTRGGVKQILCKYGLIRTVDMALQFILTFLVEYIYVPSKLEFSLTEALFCTRPPYGIDWYCRNSSVAKEISKLCCRNVLDVGGGRNGLWKFLSSGLHVCVIDIRKDAFYACDKKTFIPVLGDACALPFRDNSFDAACGISLLEHISIHRRTEAISELIRVGRNVIVHMPVESHDGVYVGKKGDLEFLKAHYRCFGFEEPSTAEHAEAGYTTLQELKENFPNSCLIGHKNHFVWLRYMLMSRVPFIGFLVGFFYLLSWKAKDDQPPYYEVMIVFKK